MKILDNIIVKIAELQYQIRTAATWKVVAGSAAAGFIAGAVIF